MCGRCEAACPVDLKLNALRLSQRTDYTHITKSTYDYIQPQPALPAKVAYFAGCMGAPHPIRYPGHGTYLPESRGRLHLYRPTDRYLLWPAYDAGW